MTRALLIGYGNSLRGDDGVGPQVVALCGREILEVETLVVQQLTPELAEPISRSSAVVFVDAEVTQQPGTVRVTELSLDRSADVPVSHHFSPLTLLEMALGLYERCPPAWLVTIGGTHFEMGEGL